MAKKQHPLYKSGETAPLSGQYQIVGSRGGDAGGAERTITKGEPFPPTPDENQRFHLVDPTKTKGK
jgi:hypothetical protein